MRAWVVVVILVAIGIVGAWVGYWLGHAMGWTTNAEFPLRIGGGGQAILLSGLVSFASVMAGIWWFVVRPVRRIGRLSATGLPGHATVQRMWRTGLVVSRPGAASRHEIAFELRVHPDGQPEYEAAGLGLLSDAEEAPLHRGSEVGIRVDARDPSTVVVTGPWSPSPI